MFLCYSSFYIFQTFWSRPRRATVPIVYIWDLSCWWVGFLCVSHRNIPTHTHTHTHNIAQLVLDCKQKCPIPPTGQLLISLGKKAILTVLFVVAFYLVPRSFHIHLYMTPIMFYMIDLGPVIISALDLSIHSLLMWCFIYTLQIIAVLVVFFIIEQWFAFLLSGSINSPSQCWCTLSLLISAHPAISPHSLPSFVVIFSRYGQL